MNPTIEVLLEKVDSKFTLVSLASRRARQVNSYFNQLGEGLGSIVPPQVASTARKPLSISFEEIAADKITYTRGDLEADDLEADDLAADDAEAADLDGDDDGVAGLTEAGSEADPAS